MEAGAEAPARNGRPLRQWLAAQRVRHCREHTVKPTFVARAAFACALATATAAGLAQQSPNVSADPTAQTPTAPAAGAIVDKTASGPAVGSGQRGREDARQPDGKSPQRAAPAADGDASGATLPSVRGGAMSAPVGRSSGSSASRAGAASGVRR